MNIVGIVAEYNPFHKGHAYQIKYAREQLHADYIIVAMSGNFTQRGLPAIMDKESRTHCALLNDVDMVIEIPTIYATASAEDFATAGVLTLAKTGLVNTLLFGGETDDIALFNKSADILINEPDWFKEQLNEQLSAGVSFAQARADALSSELPLDFLNTPNNILGIEYVKAIKKYHLDITPVCLKRVGAGYHEERLSDVTDDFASATMIRSFIHQVQSEIYFQDNYDIKEKSFPFPLDHIFHGLPESCHNIIFNKMKQHEMLFDDDLSQLLHYKLMSEESFDSYVDCTKQIANRIINNRKDFTTITDFTAIMKTKDIAYTRISRILCHILLGITKNVMNISKENGYISYLRILGFSKSGSELLTKMKQSAGAPRILQCKTAESILNETQMQVFKYDIYATDIYNILLTAKNGHTYPNEYSKKYTLGNI